MKVKKINSQWFPSESPHLAVGETVEITDPKALIVSGAVVGIGENGVELSAYELYGVLVTDEKKEFEEYLKLKKEEALNQKLVEDKKELEKKAFVETPVETPVVAPIVAPVVEEVKEAKKK